MRLKIVLAIFILMASMWSSGQKLDPVFRLYTTTDGLPSNEIFQITGDQHGYIWMATNKGVCRFDGYRFKKFNTENGLGDNSVLGFYIDANNTVWCRSIAGKISGIKGDSVVTLSKTFDVYFPNSIYADSSENIYVGGQSMGAMATYIKESEGYDFEMRRDTSSALRIRLFPDGYVFSRYGLGSKIVVDNGTSQKEYILNFEQNTPKTYVYAKNNNVYIASENRLFRIDESGQVHEKTLPHEVISITSDKAQNLWVCLNNEEGVLLFEDSDLDSEPRRIFDDTGITSVAQDFEGGYWFGTRTRGVLYVPSLQTVEYQCANILEGNDIRLFQQGNEILICNHEGDYLALTTEKNLTSGNLIRDKNGRPEWMKVIHRNCSSVHYSNNEVYHHSGDKEFHSITNARNLIPLHGGSMELGASTLFCYAADKTQSCIRESYKAPSRINASYPAGDSLLLACVDGLWYLSEREIKRTTHGTMLPEYRFDDVVVDSSGAVWLASAGKGIFIIKENKLYNITRKDGLPSDICNKILLYKSFCLIACDEGVAIIDFHDFPNYKVSALTYQNGLPCRIVNDIAFDGEQLFILADNRLITLPANISAQGHEPPRILLSSVTVNNSGVETSQLANLEHWQNTISINLLALSYINPGSNFYKYSLVGLDSIWHFTQSPEIRFSSLPPGRFVFMAKSINSLGEESDETILLEINILKPFWQTWWFALLILLLIALIVFGIISIRTSSLKKRLEEREKINAKIASIEMRALRSQMNPHFIFNCINSIQHFVLSSDPHHANKQLAKFARLVRNVLELSDLQWVEVGKELETIKLYTDMESMRFDSRFEYVTDIDPKVDQILDTIPPLLIQPFVENAIVHGLLPLKGRQGKIILSMKKYDDLIECVIEDNGIGREKARLIGEAKRIKTGHHSMGISLTQERLNIYNHSGRNQRKIELKTFDLIDKDGAAAGTRIVLTLPIQTSR